MACNNTYRSRDAAGAFNSKVRNQQPLAVRVEKVAREAYPEFREKTIQQIRDALRDDKSSNAHKKWFQKMGEMYATKAWAAPQLGVSQIGFFAATHGIDHIGLTRDGKLAVFETKCFGKVPYDAGLTQLSRGHLESRFGRMQIEGRKEAQGRNPEIAERAKELEIVRYLVHVCYDDKSVQVWEVIDGPDGEPQKGELKLDAHAREFMGSMYPFYFED